MNSLSGLKEELLKYLEASRRLEGVRLLEEHPGERRELALPEPTVAVGIDSVELESGGLGGYYGQAGERSVPLYGQGVRITVRFDLFCPREGGGGGCHRLYETLCDLLMLEREGPFAFEKMWCGEISWDSLGGDFHLRAWAALRAALTREEDGTPVRDVIVLRRDVAEEKASSRAALECREGAASSRPF